MKICPNCCTDLVCKKYKKSKKIKCMECGYETSEWYLRLEREEYEERVRKQEFKLYNHNEETE